MEAERDGTRPLEYHQHIGGDLIYGTKDELQALGLGADRAFPGEPGGPKRVLHVPDPRGFAAKIELARALDGVRYCAIIYFPGRNRPDEPWDEVAPGLKKRKCIWFDEFTGTPEVLAAAGLARPDQLPGQPGMRKMRVRFLPDGSIPIRPHRHKDGMPGAKVIERASTTTYSVRIVVPEDEEERRRGAWLRAEREHEIRMLAMPRPAPLTARTRPSQAGAHLRLVWSRPGA